MAQLIVRNVEDAVVRALKVRAARKGHSAEAEHRELLRQALLDAPRRGLKELLRSMPDAGGDALFARDRSRARKVKL